MLALCGVAAYIVRDLPRRALESALSLELGTEVELQTWKVLAKNRFELHGLQLSSFPGAPEMFLHIPVVYIEGAPRELIKGTIQRLTLERAVLGIRVPESWSQNPQSGEQAVPIITEFEVPGMDIFICTDEPAQDCSSSDRSTHLQLDARFRNLGSSPKGSLRVQGANIELHRDLETEHPLRGRIDDLLLSGDLDRDTWALSASAGAISVAQSGHEIRAQDLQWRGTQRNSDGSTGPVETVHAAMGGGDWIFQQHNARLPPIRWTPMDPTSERPRRQLLAMESELWRSARVTFESSSSGVSVGFEAQAVELGELLAIVPRSFIEPLQTLQGTADGKWTLDLPTSPDNGSPSWKTELTLRPETLSLSAVSSAATMAGSAEPMRFSPGAVLHLEMDGSGLPGDALQAQAQGSVELTQISWPPFDDLPNSAWPMSFRFQGNMNDERAQADSFELQTGLFNCGGDAGLDLKLDRAPDGTMPEAHNAALAHWRCHGSASDLLAVVSPTWPRPLGPSSWLADGRLRSVEGSWAADGRAELDIRSIVIDPELPDLHMEALHTAFRFEAGPEQIRLRDMQGSFELSSPDLSSLGAKFHAEVDARLDRPGDGASLNLRALELSGVDPETEQAMVLAKLALNAGGLPERTKATFELTDWRPQSWLRWASPMLPETTRGLTSQGQGRFTGRLDRRHGGWDLTGPIELSGFGIANADGSRVLEGLDAQVELKGHWPLEGANAGQIELDLKGRAGGFLMLWQTLFSDFSELDTEFSIGMTSPPNNSAARPQTSPEPLRSPWDLRLDLQPRLSQGRKDPTLSLSAEFWPTDRTAKLKLKIDAPDLESFHEQVLTRLQDDPPSLTALSGSAHIEAEGTIHDRQPGLDWAARGRAQVRDTRLSSAGIELRDMNLDLPIDLSRSGPDHAPIWNGPETIGHFRLGPSQIADIELPAIESELAIQADSVTMRQPLMISLLGGTVEMSRFTLKDLARANRFAETALKLDGLSLEQMTEANDLPSFIGRLDGELPKVTLAGQSLRVFGGGTLKVFGGEIEVRDISGSEIFTPFPKLRLSAELRQISLERLTERFDFGKVTGLLSGQIEDCDLFRGVPTAFRASFRTERTAGIAQSVDVKAVKNLTILGTGQGSNIFDRGIQRFLSSYRYSALGVRVRLQNDVLLLEGLQHRGSRELFLKGGFPFGIDIVNARPGQTVSFQTMVGRLQSLDFNAATIEN